MLKERNYKDIILNSEFPMIGGGKRIFKYEVTPSMGSILDHLDSGRSICIHSYRQSKKLLTSTMYAAQILLNEDGYVVLYSDIHNTDTDYYSQGFMLILHTMSPYLSDEQIYDICNHKFVVNPKKSWLKKNIKDVNLIIYDDIFKYKHMHDIDLKTARNTLSVIASMYPDKLKERTGFDNFDYEKWMFYEDGKDMRWFDLMCNSLCSDWHAIRGELLLEPYDNPGTPITDEEMNELKEMVKKHKEGE